MKEKENKVEVDPILADSDRFTFDEPKYISSEEVRDKNRVETKYVDWTKILNRISNIKPEEMLAKENSPQASKKAFQSRRQVKFVPPSVFIKSVKTEEEFDDLNKNSYYAGVDPYIKTDPPKINKTEEIYISIIMNLQIH